MSKMTQESTTNLAFGSLESVFSLCLPPCLDLINVLLLLLSVHLLNAAQAVMSVREQAGAGL